MSDAAFTIIAKNYLPYARVLMDSVRRHAPDMQRVVVLVDRPDGYFDPGREDFEVVFSDELDIPASRWFHFKYTILELSTAVKPYVFQYLMRRKNLDRIVYFDPDIKLFESPDIFLRPLDRDNILLAPHLTAPIQDDRRPSEMDILRYGAYNLGFIAVRACPEVDRFLAWWADKLYDQCRVDLPNGLFVDQKWLDLAPGLFEGVCIARESGYDVAYWNLQHRGAALTDGPLYFFHFSGFDPDDPERFSRYQDRFTLDGISAAARKIVLDYRDDLLGRGYAQSKAWPYGHRAFANGIVIPDAARQVHRVEANLVSRVPDPFSEEGFRAIVEVWNQTLTDRDGQPTPLTRLAHSVYKSRPDIQMAMPDVFGADLAAYLNWFRTTGKLEHNLDDVFLPATVNLRPAARHTINEKIVQTVYRGRRIAGAEPIQVETLNEIAGNGAGRLHLTRLAEAIYEGRADLKKLFPDPRDRDAGPFLAWFLTYGADEYGLDEALVAPLREQWNGVVDSIESPLDRLRTRCRYWAMKRSVRRRAPRPSRARPQARSPATGVNFIGYVRSEMGVGESVRCSVKGARAAGIPVAIKSVDFEGPYRRADDSAGPEDQSHPYDTNVFQVNADVAEAVMEKAGPRFREGRRNIGYWVWELEDFPRRWLGSFRLFDEIWAPSSFCQAAFARKSPVPVVRIPYAVQVESRVCHDRADFSIPREPFVFLAIFDLLSVFERKNPLGVLEAFRQAIPSGSHLVLKINHAGQRSDEMARIRQAAAGLPVTIIDRTIDRDDVTALMRVCDCLVSLHRSEGFGLTIAEAMYLGKPVIATDYSGNRDFANSSNAFPVDYDLVRVPKGCEPYEEGMVWAEPRLAHAVEQMRLVVESADIRNARAARGAESIRELLAPAVTGALMRERLDYRRLLP